MKRGNGVRVTEAGGMGGGGIDTLSLSVDTCNHMTLVSCWYIYYWFVENRKKVRISITTFLCYLENMHSAFVNMNI